MQDISLLKHSSEDVELYLDTWDHHGMHISRALGIIKAFASLADIGKVRPGCVRLKPDLF